jgi:uncharacterized protein YkwD
MLDLRSRSSKSTFSRTRILILAMLVAVTLLLVALPGLASAKTYSSEELSFLQLINQYRQSNGLGTLLLSDTISDASTKHSSDMAKYDFFAHDTVQSDYFPAGSTPWDRMRICGYTYNTAMGENIAAGYANAQAVFTGWKNSPGHNANMLNASYRVIGIGLVTGGSYGEYWTTDFGGYVDPSAHDPGSASPTTTARPTTTTTTTWPATTTTTKPATTTTTTAPAPTTTTTAPPVSPSFRDVHSNSTFYAAINSLAAAGVVSGFADGSFRPADPVTRAQFAKIIVLATGGYGAAPAATQATFPDVPFTGASYPFDFVEEAVALGIIQGYDDGLFGPSDDVTRAQIAIMIVRSGGTKLTQPPTSYVAPYTDLGDCSSEAADAIRIATYNGLCSGIGNSLFDPYAQASRGQVAQMVYGLYLAVH